jgi:hypothetical protein
LVATNIEITRLRGEVDRLRALLTDTETRANEAKEDNAKRATELQKARTADTEALNV